jgi:hypothetical protein
MCKARSIKNVSQNNEINNLKFKCSPKEGKIDYNCKISVGYIKPIWGVQEELRWFIFDLTTKHTCDILGN